MTIILLFGGTPTAGTVTERSKRRAIAAGASVAPELFLVRYDTAGTTWKEIIRRPSNLGVRWALPGGLQRLEFTVKASSRFDARQRYTDHLGDRIALFDAMMDTPICDGWIYEIVPDGVHVHYIVAGAWKRHTDIHTTLVPSATTDDTDVYLEYLLTDSGGIVAPVSTTMTNIAATGTDIGDYEPDQEIGTLGQDVIAEILKMGNSSDQILDYWIVPNAVSGIYPQLPLAYLAGRDNTAAASWQCRERDLSALDLSRNIWDLTNKGIVLYTQTTTLSVDATDGASTINVNSATGFSEGDEIQVQVDTGNFNTAIIDGISGTVITLTDGLSDAATSGNLVKNNQLQPTASAGDADSQASYWLRESIQSQDKLNATQAAQYRDALIAQYANPAQLASFTVGSGYIRNYAGSRLPVWRMLIDPGIIRINDLFADGSTFTNSIDGLQSFRIVGLDYDHNRRSMRVTPDTLNEARLDVLLQRAGIEGVGQIVDRG